MRGLAWWTLMMASVAGCLGSSGDAANGSDEVFDAHGSRTSELGSQSGTSITPSRIPFAVEVPLGGAREVRWDLTFEQPVGTSVVHTIEGPGCRQSNGLSSGNEVSGVCDDLAAGSHSFEVVLDGPVGAFAAVVTGTVAF